MRRTTLRFSAMVLFGSLLFGCNTSQSTPPLTQNLNVGNAANAGTAVITNPVNKAIMPNPNAGTAVVANSTACSSVSIITVTAGTCPSSSSSSCPAGMNLAWEDNFPPTYDGAPDPSKWTYQTGNQNGWGNGELEDYMNNTSSTKNSYISPGGGMLNIAAIYQSVNGFQYTSARLNSLKSWLYGHFEVKAQVPNGLGSWPGIWMMPESSQYGGWPNSGELDILETVGFSVHTAHVTVHGAALQGQSNPGNGVSYTLPAPTDDSALHVYAMDWTPQKISFTMDGTPYPGSYSKPAGATWQQWPFDQPFYFILNVAVGGSWGGQQGVNAAAFAAPGQIMQIQHVLVCQ